MKYFIFNDNNHIRIYQNQPVVQYQHILSKYEIQINMHK